MNKYILLKLLIFLLEQILDLRAPQSNVHLL